MSGDLPHWRTEKLSKKSVVVGRDICGSCHHCQDSFAPAPYLRNIVRCYPDKTHRSSLLPGT